MYEYNYVQGDIIFGFRFFLILKVIVRAISNLSTRNYVEAIPNLHSEIIMKTNYYYIIVKDEEN